MGVWGCGGGGGGGLPRNLTFGQNTGHIGVRGGGGGGLPPRIFQIAIFGQKKKSM